MLPQLDEIKLKRKQQGMTQSGLAAYSGVSQSLIAKLEAGKIVPSYDKAKKVFDSLEKLHSETQLTARDVMVGRIISVKEDESLKKAVSALEKNAVSQLPVMKQDHCVGLLTEKSVLAKMGSKDIQDIEHARVEEAMEDSIPTIQENTPLPLVSDILNYAPAVLVKKKGKIKGIITKSDLLKAMMKKH